MKFKDMPSAICKAEGLKSQVSIGNVREIIRIIIDLEVGIRYMRQATEGPIALMEEKVQVKLEKMIAKKAKARKK